MGEASQCHRVTGEAHVEIVHEEDREPGDHAVDDGGQAPLPFEVQSETAQPEADEDEQRGPPGVLGVDGQRAHERAHGEREQDRVGGVPVAAAGPADQLAHRVGDRPEGVGDPAAGMVDVGQQRRARGHHRAGGQLGGGQGPGV